MKTRFQRRTAVALAIRAPTRLVLFPIVCVLVLAAPGAAAGDTVYFKNGRTLNNVETRIDGDRLIVIQNGAEMAFPMSLVERIEEGEVVAPPPRPPAPQPAGPPAGPGAGAPGAGGSDAGSSSLPASSNAPTEYKVGDRLPKRVRLNNGIDVITLDLPPGWWVYAGSGARRRATGQDDDPFGHMDPVNVMRPMPKDVEVVYSLYILPILYFAWDRIPEDDLADEWLSMARTELRNGPMQTVSAPRQGQRRVGADVHATTTYRHFWEDSGFAQDGIFLLVFPRDYKQEMRFYALQWFVTYAPEAGKIDPYLDGLDTVVRSFNVRPIR